MTPRRRAAWRAALPLLLAVGFLGLMVYSGHFAPSRQLARFATQGVLHVPPERIQRITLSVGAHTVVFLRHPEQGWLHGQNAVAEDLQAHLTMALVLLHRSGPLRRMAPADYQPTPLAEFGLEAPAYRVLLEDQTQTLVEVHFGTMDPQALAQYMRVLGSDAVYLMSRFVGEAWAHVWEHVAPSSLP